MKRDEQLILYSECWDALKTFLLDVLHENPSEYFYVHGVLNLMWSFEHVCDRR